MIVRTYLERTAVKVEHPNEEAKAVRRRPVQDVDPVERASDIGTTFDRHVRIKRIARLDVDRLSSGIEHLNGDIRLDDCVDAEKRHTFGDCAIETSTLWRRAEVVEEVRGCA